MPKRTNQFQRLILLLQKQLSGVAEVNESEMLIDRRNKEETEVDVVVYGKQGVHRPVISIECRDHKRPQSKGWVNEMYAKHEYLPTTDLILASSSGFTKPAERLANLLGIRPVKMNDASSVEWTKLVGKQANIKISEYFRFPLRCTVEIGDDWMPAGMLQSELAELPLYNAKDVSIGSLKNILDLCMENKDFNPEFDHHEDEKQVMLADVSIQFEPGSYTIDKRGDKHILDGLKYRIEHVRINRYVPLENYEFMGSQVAIAKSNNGQVEILYSIAEQQKENPVFGAVVSELKKNPKGRCKWDASVKHALADKSKVSGVLNYNDQNQYKNTPDVPEIKNISIRVIANEVTKK